MDQFVGEWEKLVKEWRKPGGKKLVLLSLAIFLGILALIITLIAWSASNSSTSRISVLNSIEVKFKQGYGLQFEEVRSQIVGQGFIVLRADSEKDELLNCKCDAKWYGKLRPYPGLSLAKDADTVVLIEERNQIVSKLEILRPAR